MKNAIGFIYVTTNLVNSKKYVGQRRICGKSSDDTYLGSGNLIKRAINKYGTINFKREILEYCECPKKLNEREVFWINEINCFSPIGYNLSVGGDQIISIKEHPNKQDIIKRRVISFRKTYNSNPEIAIRRKKQLDEARKKVDFKNIVSTRRKKIVEIDINTGCVLKTYDSIRIAEKELNISGFSSAINNKNLCGGKYYQYFNENGIYEPFVKKEVWNKGLYVNLSPETQFKKGNEPWNKNLKGIHLSPRSEFKKGQIPWNKGVKGYRCKDKHHNSKRVIKLSLNKEFEFEYFSFSHAKEYGFNDKGVRRACRKILGEYKGYLWILKTDYEKGKNK